MSERPPPSPADIERDIAFEERRLRRLVLLQLEDGEPNANLARLEAAARVRLRQKRVLLAAIKGERLPAAPTREEWLMAARTDVRRMVEMTANQKLSQRVRDMAWKLIAAALREIDELTNSGDKPE